MHQREANIWPIHPAPRVTHKHADRTDARLIFAPTLGRRKYRLHPCERIRIFDNRILSSSRDARDEDGIRRANYSGKQVPARLNADKLCSITERELIFDGHKFSFAEIMADLCRIATESRP